MKPRDRSFFDQDVCKPFIFNGNQTGIVLIHGFTGSVAHMRPLGEALHQLGYTVMGINLPGHASTEEDMDRFGDTDWLQAAIDAVSVMREQCNTVAVCGLSMGAVLSLLVAEQDRVDACIPISAPMPAASKLMPFSAALSKVIHRVSWKVDPNRKEQLDQRYDKGYTGYPLRKAMDLHRLIKLAKDHLPSVTCPLLVVQSTADTSVNQESADTIFSGANSMQKTKLILHAVPHVCTLSKELPAIVGAVDQLLISIK